MNATPNLIEALRNELCAALGDSISPEQQALIERADFALLNMPAGARDMAVCAFELSELLDSEGGLHRALDPETRGAALLTRAIGALCEDADRIGHFLSHTVGAP